MISDGEILALANRSLVLRPELQIAHDRMMVFAKIKNIEEYRKYWQAYLNAGGDRTMCDKGIDLDNWLRVREICPTLRAVELGDSAASQALPTPEVLSTQQAESTPAPIH